MDPQLLDHVRGDLVLVIPGTALVLLTGLALFLLFRSNRRDDPPR